MAAWAWYLPGVPFYVHAQDRPGTLPEMEALAEAHWSYLDRYADQLILRGPTLSGEGTEHTGSVHVIDLDDRASAERFATEEPYWLDGLYRHVTISRTVVLLRREPVDDTAALRAPSALITGRWAHQPRDAGGTGLKLPEVSPEGRVRFMAVLVDDSQSCTTGIAAIVSAVPGEALRIVQPLADQLAGGRVTLTAQRWQGGGRS
jgi:uncharacterized protein